MISKNYSHISSIMSKVRYKQGNIIETYYLCDSDYILSTIIRVWHAIREIIYWFPRHERVCLFIDGAGGHTTNKVINEYDKKLMFDFNIKPFFQVPRTPYSNVLDLGIWCRSEADIEKDPLYAYMRCWCTYSITIWNFGKVIIK